MNPFLAEALGTMVLILLGNGVVANVLLPQTKGHNGGLIVITAGWACAVFCGAAIANAASGAHLNPALTIALMAVGKISFSKAILFIVFQMIGAMVGAYLVYQFYKDHFMVCESPDIQLACFSTGPAIRNPMRSLFCEGVGTFVLVLTILMFEAPEIDKFEKFGLGTIGLVPVALLVFGIGLSLGGTTGYAINPARDLGPRIIHQFVSLPGKRDSDWDYAWIPVAGPIIGGLAAAVLYRLLVVA